MKERYTCSYKEKENLPKYLLTISYKSYCDFHLTLWALGFVGFLWGADWDFVRGLWGWPFGFWPCGGLVGMALFTGWGTCKKHNNFANFAGFPTWGAVFVGFSRGWGSGCGFSRAFRGSFAFLLVSRRVSQVLDHIVLYSFPWLDLVVL